VTTWTELHDAAKRGQLDVVQRLLAEGADPNAREPGDNTYPLHWAAAHGHLEVARALLDAGGDVHGIGDVHALDVIGWATFYHDPDVDPGTIDPARRALVNLLVERGARHHVFSAMSLGDLNLLRALVEQHPDSLERRLSRFEHGLTPLHFAISRKQYDMLDLLIELGADLEGVDGRGNTALTTAMLEGDREAVRRLQAAGAKVPATTAPADFTAKMASLSASVTKNVPMVSVPDVAAALDWYVSIGFKEIGRYDENGVVNFGIVSFGGAELMFTPGGQRGTHDVSLWLNTDRIDAFYQLLTSRQMATAQAALTADGEGDTTRAIEFDQHIEDMFYGARQFCIRDLNGYLVYFIQSIENEG
jgi:catechol 2,3-dioxygenase-like lactoylglutathione lyase family enzyme